MEAREAAVLKARRAHRHGSYRNGRPLLHPGHWAPRQLNDEKLASRSMPNDHFRFCHMVPVIKGLI